MSSFDLSNASAHDGDVPSVDPCIKCDEMKTSVKIYDRHVILCLPHLALSSDEAIGLKWPAKIDEIPIVSYITGKLNTALDNNVTLKITACDYNNYGGSSFCWAAMSQISFIVYPEAVLVSLPVHLPDELALTVSNDTDGSVDGRRIANLSPLDRFLAWAVKPIAQSPVSDLTEVLQNESTVSAVPWSKLILVCTHANRDKRCGRAGPQVVAALQKEISELVAIGTSGDSDALRSYQICGSSHVGGHKFAGTLIVYPEADWFGRVTKSTAKALLQHIRNRGGGPAVASEADVAVRAKCFRGNGFCESHNDHEW